MNDPSNPVTESDIYEQGFADGKAESAETIEQLQRERMSLINLLAEVRIAIGDNGLRMQHELAEYCRKIAGQAATAGQLRDALNKALAENLANRMKPTHLDAVARQGCHGAIAR